MFLNDEQKQRFRGWLQAAYGVVQEFDGSEAAQDRLMEPLALMDSFMRSNASQDIDPSLERLFTQVAWPEAPRDFERTINGIIEQSWQFYERLTNANSLDFVFSQLEKGGANVLYRDRTMVQTDDGQLQEGRSDEKQTYEVKTAPRLAFLIKKLSEIGIYTDDLIVHVGKTDPNMMRVHPYVLVQIPRLGKEINICDQIGETPFMGHSIHDPLLWEYLSKDQLKARDDIEAIAFYNESQWWNDIQSILTGQERKPKQNVRRVAATKFPLDLELIKDSILAHRLTTGIWPGQKTGLVQYGPYADNITTWTALHLALHKGSRGLPIGTSLSTIMQAVSDERGLDYFNHQAQDNLDIGEIKECILQHYRATQRWPSGKKGLVQYGPYANGKTTWLALDSSLREGVRGLPGNASLAALNQEVSDEHGLNYFNHLRQNPLDIHTIKQSILKHYQTTKQWPTHQSGNVEYGPYANKETWLGIDSALRSGVRGLPGGSSIAKVNEALSIEHGLQYRNIKKLELLNIDLIEESILQHRKATAKWPSVTSSDIQYGPYAGQENWKGIHNALNMGLRGLSSGSSLAALCETVSQKHNLDYVNRKKQKNFEIKKIKDCIIKHYQETGGWPTQTSGIIKFGDYADGQITWQRISAMLARGQRGLPGGSSLAALNQEVSDEHGLNYFNHLQQDNLDIGKIKDCILEHYRATKKWPTDKTTLVEYGPYADGRTKWASLNAALRIGLRGLPGKSSIAALNQEVSDEHGLNYFNHLQQDNLDIGKIKDCILEHYRATEKWPTDKTGLVEYGPYADGKTTWKRINAMLARGQRGLPGGSSLAKIRQERQKEMAQGTWPHITAKADNATEEPTP